MKIALSQYNAPNSLIVQTPSYVPYPLSLRTPALPLLLPSHRTRDDTAPFTRSSVLVFSHPRWRRPGERSIQNPIDAIDPFPFSFACRRHLKLSLHPVTIPFACSWPFRRAATPPLSLAPLLSLRDCEPASDLKNYCSNSHSVELPPALQYSSELRWISEGWGQVVERVSHCK